VLKLFKPKRDSLLGIDINSSAVKILEISGLGDEPCVEAYGLESLPRHVLDGNKLKDINAVSACIEHLLHRCKLTSKQVALAVPDSSVITKIIHIHNGLTCNEMEEIIVLEAEKYIPYPIAEINLDFKILGPSPLNTSLLDVLIVASRSENINTRVEAVTRAGLQVRYVDVESYAVERVAQQILKKIKGHNQIIAIIDIGHHYLNLFVVHRGRLVFTKVDQLVEQPFIESKVIHSKKTNVEEVLAPFKDRVLLQIKRTLQFFYTSTQHRHVDHILLAGELVRYLDLITNIQTQLKVETSIVNLLVSIPVNPQINLEQITYEAPAFIIAFGLALRHAE
jgi:type IV pilus assembly protein PilM